MKQVHKAVRWEDSDGYLELHFHPNNSVSGHWKAWDGKTYQNSPLIEENGTQIKDAVEFLAFRAVGKDNCDDIIEEILQVIGRELKVDSTVP